MGAGALLLAELFSCVGRHMAKQDLAVGGDWNCQGAPLKTEFLCDRADVKDRLLGSFDEFSLTCVPSVWRAKMF